MLFSEKLWKVSAVEVMSNFSEDCDKTLPLGAGRLWA